MTHRFFTVLKSGIRAAVNNRIKYLIFHVTYRCDARCLMCFNHQFTQNHIEDELTLDEIDTFTRNLPFLPQLTLSGGEPLMRNDADEVVHLFYKNSGTRFFSVPTNALSPVKIKRFTEHFLKNCPDAFLNFCIPMHHIHHEYDKIMGVKDAFEKLQESYDIIEYYHKNHNNISCLLDCVITRYNHADFIEIFRYAKSRFSSFPVGPTFCRGNTRNQEAGNFPPESYQTAVYYQLQNWNNRNPLNPYAVMFETIGRQICDTVMRVVNGDMKDLKCRAGKNMVVLKSNGDFVPCELIGMTDTFSGNAPPPHNLGNLRDYNYNPTELLRSPQSVSLLNWIRTQPCACTWECAIYNKIMHSPKELCRLGLRVLQTVFKRSIG